MKPRFLSVYEALNPARKEIFVGVTERSLLELIAIERKRLPLEIAHWEPSEVLEVRRLAEDMPEGDAWQFSVVYVGYIERKGWTIIRQKPND